MAKECKNSEISSESEACEIIELAIDDLDLLTRAFDVINEVCLEAQRPALLLDGAIPKELLN